MEALRCGSTEQEAAAIGRPSHREQQSYEGADRGDEEATGEIDGGQEEEQESEQAEDDPRSDQLDTAEEETCAPV